MRLNRSMRRHLRRIGYRRALAAGLPLLPIAGGANNLDMYIPELWAQETLMFLEKNLVMAMLVHRDFENVVAARGDTIHTRKPRGFTAQSFTGSLTIQDMQADNVDVVLSEHIHVAFKLDDRTRSLAVKDLVNEYLGPAGYAIADKIDQDLYALYKDVPWYFGTAGTTPSTISAITGVRKVLQDNAVPLQDRRLTIDPAAEDKFLQLGTFHEADKLGDQGTALREASLGRKFGFDIYTSQNAPLHTAGVPGGTPTATGTAGQSTVAIAGGGAAGTFKRGDLITIAGDALPYVVTADLTLNGAGAGTLAIYPALRFSPSGAAVTVVGNHRVNLAFHKNAFALVTRPLDAPPEGTGVRSAVVDRNGIGVRVLIGYDITALSMVAVLDILYGVRTLDPFLAARLLG